MIRVTDIDAIAETYLAGLNTCFPGWGDARTFDWCFRRATGGPAADLFVIEAEGEPVAGTAVTYRNIATPDGPVRIACMTGSWTLPAARRQGHFGRMIATSQAQAAVRGCITLVGWSAATNRSVPQLIAMSERVLDTAYLTAPTEGAPAPELRTIPRDEAAPAFAARPAPDAIHLRYTAEEWQGQMLDRPRPVEALALPWGDVALVERGQGRDLLVDATGDLARAAGAVAAASRTQGKALATFSVDPATIAALEAEGFASAPGHFFLLPVAGAPPLPEGRWHIANGDRM